MAFDTIMSALEEQKENAQALSKRGIKSFHTKCQLSRSSREKRSERK